MEFLKEILGEALFAQFEEKINAYNGNEANKDRQIEIGNLDQVNMSERGNMTHCRQYLMAKKPN